MNGYMIGIIWLIGIPIIAFIIFSCFIIKYKRTGETCDFGEWLELRSAGGMLILVPIIVWSLIIGFAPIIAIILSIVCILIFLIGLMIYLFIKI